MRERYASMVGEEPLDAVVKKVGVARSPWNHEHPWVVETALDGSEEGVVGDFVMGEIGGFGHWWN